VTLGVVLTAASAAALAAFARAHHEAATRG
jgi:hypothetical protein